MSRQCCQRSTGKLQCLRGSLSDCFYGILACKIIVFVTNCNVNNQFATVCIWRHVFAVSPGSSGLQLFIFLARTMNRDCWTVDIDLADLRLQEFLQKSSCGRFAINCMICPVALELCRPCMPSQVREIANWEKISVTDGNSRRNGKSLSSDFFFQ